MQLGEVYHISDEAYSANGHYYFVISKEAEDGLYLVVNCTTLRPGLHQEADHCILQPGDYVGIKHKSIMVFHRSRLLNDTKLAEAAAAGFTVFCQPAAASPNLIKKIQKAFETSKDVPERFRAYGFYFR